MIVASMNSEELINEILKDFPIVFRKAKYLTQQVRREAIKTRNKQLICIFEYKSQQKNDWLIRIDYNNADPLILPSVYYLNRGQFNAVVINNKLNLNIGIKESLVHYSSHFLERFNERFLKEPHLSKFEVLKRFIRQNNITTCDGFADKFGNTTGKTVACFKDGYGLGLYEQYYNKQIIYIKTYISSDMLFENQKLSYAGLTQFFMKQWDEFLKSKPD